MRRPQLFTPLKHPYIADENIFITIFELIEIFRFNKPFIHIRI